MIDPGAGRPSSEVSFSALNPTTIVTRPSGPAASASSESQGTTSTLVGVGGGNPGQGPAVSVPGTSPAIVPIHTDPPAPGSGGNEHAPGGYTYGPPPPLDDPRPSGSAPGVPGVPGAPGAGGGGVSNGDSPGPAMTPAAPVPTPDPDPVVINNTAVPYRPTTAAGPEYSPVLAGAPGSNMKARSAGTGVLVGLLGYIAMALLG